MKKIWFTFIILFFAIGAATYYFANTEIINHTNSESNRISVALRYVLPVTEQIKFPNNLDKTEDNNYELQFKQAGSDIKYFDSLTFDENVLLLDIKAKYVVKTNYLQIDQNILITMFGLTLSEAKQIILILNTETTITKRKDAVNDYCQQISKSQVYEKGLKKMVKF